ncbi:ChaN family lipoprotein [Oceanicaulis sp. AH-315-P02]|nr:ChaN family lipoprotein [Robiginitomaculum sp.]MBN4047895.1 ChaN family lipoprotein [Oceanicaulis sp. AH-315-P02]
MSKFQFSAAVMLGAVLFISACETAKPTQEARINKDGENYVVSAPIDGFFSYVLIETQMGKITPKIVDIDYVLADLASYDVVFVGEAHGHVTNHYIQSKLFSGLHKKSPNIALSMEQFERRQQNIVDQYLASEIGEESLVFDGKAWPHYRSSYRPLVEYAKHNNLPVIAAEIPSNLVSCISEKGPEFLSSLPDEARSWVAEDLDLEDGAYKDKFYRFMDGAAGHSIAGNQSDEELARKKLNRYAAQVSRDDTMAESIAKHISDNPGRKVFHITGSFHSAEMLGTPERVLSRLPDLKIANIHPILVNDPKNPSFSADDLKQGQYLLLLYPVPKRFVQMKNINAFIKRTQASLDKDTCTY